MSTTRICIHGFVPSITLSVAHHLDCHFAYPTAIKGCLICNDVLLPVGCSIFTATARRIILSRAY